MNKVIICFASVLISLTVFGQKDLPNLSKMNTIRAKSNMVSIREGNEF